MTLTTRWLLSIALPLLFAPGVHPLTAAAGDAIQLRPAETLRAGDVALDVGDYAIPVATDWNGDGRTDLLVGYQDAGKVALFLNSGANAQPVFTTSVNLQAGGVDIQHPSFGCGAPAPWVCDYDHDGKRDLLVGAGGNGQVYFYRQINREDGPGLAAGVPLKVGSAPLNVTTRATPCVQDWDEDGREDLLCGAGDGKVYFFRNTGTVAVPAYAAGVPLLAGGNELNPGIRSVPRVFDWDGDGRKDLVASSTAGVYWCRNLGSNATPDLAGLVALAAPVASQGLIAINTGYRMRLDLVDWNGDGVMDLLLGNADGTVFWYPGYRFAVTSIQPSVDGAWVLSWASASFLKYDVLGGPSLDGLSSVAASQVLSGGLITHWTNSAGLDSGFFRVRVAP